MPRSLERQRCCARTSAGKPCTSWVRRDGHSPHCVMHSPRAMPRYGRRRCRARSQNGLRCGNYVQVAACGPELCWIHANPARLPSLRHGYYRTTPCFTPQQSVFIARLAREGPHLSADLLLVRIKLRGLLAYLARPALVDAYRLNATKLIFMSVRGALRRLSADFGREYGMSGKQNEAPCSFSSKAPGWWPVPLMNVGSWNAAADCVKNTPADVARSPCRPPPYIHEETTVSQITYRVNTRLTVNQFKDVLARSTLAARRPISDDARLQSMLDHANLTVTAWDGDLLVGISRALTDFSFCCYLSDLAVDQAYQRQGIGKELVHRTHQAAGAEQTVLVLLSAPAAMDYYPRIGLEQVDNAFLIRRTA